ncbi:MAG: DUF86 domain-containing protein [Defluviitaleaceae bacterium]|nr:DUF86 domain-containing protein [Defluviitaleaceae bacterium]
MVKNKLSIYDIKQAVEPIAKEYGVERVYLFGSYARGDNTADSDIDLRCEGGNIYGEWMSNDFQNDMQDRLGVKVDVVSISNPNSEFIKRISSDHVLLYEAGVFLEEPVFVPEEQRRSSFLSKLQRDEIILKRVLKYCREIPQFIERFGNDYELFCNDFAYKNSVSMSVFQIGEHTNRLSDDFRTKFVKMPWTKIKAMRNVIAHEYYEIDIETLWKIAQEYVPELQEYCEDALKQLQQEGD